MPKLKMEALARRAVRPYRGEIALELAAETLAVGDALTGSEGTLSVGAPVSCLVAGPGVDPDWFGIVDETEIAAREAAEADKAAAIAAGPFGEGSCPVATWFVSSLDPTTLVAAREGGHALRAASDAKKAKAQRLTRVALVLEWAVGRLRVLTQDRFPAEAAALPVGRIATKGKLTWAKPLFDIYDYAMAARRFDLERELAGDPEALEAVRAALSTARLGRLGALSLRSLREHVDFSAKGYQIREQSLPEIIGALAGALERALELQLLEAQARHRATSTPPTFAWLDTLLDDLDSRDPPLGILARM